MTYVVVGATGLLGRHVSRLLAARRLPRVLFGRSAVSGDGHVSHLDIRDPYAVDRAIRRAVPRVVINAAYDKSDWQTTAVGPANLARACARHGARLIHISSDAVFSGSASSYDESCPPDPVTPYGAAKAAAETAVAVIENSAVVRTSWLLGDGTAPFEGDDPSGWFAAHAAAPFERLVRELATGESDGFLHVDDIAMPLHAADLASAVLEIAEHGYTGTIHVAGREPMSRHELGMAYAKWVGLDVGSLPRGYRYGDDGPVAVKLDSSMARRVLRTRIRRIDEIYSEGRG